MSALQSTPRRGLPSSSQACGVGATACSGRAVAPLFDMWADVSMRVIVSMWLLPLSWLDVL